MVVDPLIITVGLVGVVIVVAALLSGVIERTGLPQVAVFLVIGAVLGPTGLGVLHLDLQSPALRVFATLSLVLVLFTDAVSLDLKEVRQNWRLALLVVGPGTLISAALMALAGALVLGLPLLSAVMLGTALASTDPILLRGLFRRRDIPATARLGLRLESGLNDVVLLPVVVVAIQLATSPGGARALPWGRLVLDMLVLGPGAGVVVGLVAVLALDWVRKHMGVRRDYESLYALGVAFTAFAAAETVHGSGFLAAFAAGLTITALDVDLCDCFLEYGETTAEMALLLTFVLLGASLIWTGIDMIGFATLAFAALVFLVRPVALLTSLARLNLERPARRLIAWFGPRGLSSLLLVLLPVFAGVPGSERLFALCSLVVLLSVVLHGGWPMLLAFRSRRAEPAPTPTLVPAAAGSTVAAAPPSAPGPSEVRVSIEQMQAWMAKGEPIVVLDVRSERSFAESDMLARGALRVEPVNAALQVRRLGLPQTATLVAFCT